jgi:uncharacterized Fe-S cluster protein YjdI
MKKSDATETCDEVAREYTNGEITVVWKPALCADSERCWRGLRSVFDPWQRPWINMHGADTPRIRESRLASVRPAR